MTTRQNKDRALSEGQLITADDAGGFVSQEVYVPRWARLFLGVHTTGGDCFLEGKTHDEGTWSPLIPQEVATEFLSDAGIYTYVAVPPIIRAVNGGVSGEELYVYYTQARQANPLPQVVIGGGTGTGDVTQADLDAVRVNLESADTALDASIQQLDLDLSAVESEQTTQNTRLDSLDTEQSAQDTRLDGIDTAQTSQNSRLDTIEAGQNTQNTRLDSLDTSISTHTGRLDTLDSGQTAQNTRLDGLDSGQTAQNTRLDTIDTEQTAQDNRLTTIENGQTTQNTRLDGIDTAQTTQDNRLDTLDSGQAAQNTRLDGIDSGQVAQNSRLDTLEAEQTTQNTSLSTLNTSLTGQAAQITSILAGQTTQNTQLTALGTEQDTQDSRLDAIETEQTTQNNRLDDVEVLLPVDGSGNTLPLASEAFVRSMDGDLFPNGTHYLKTNRGWPVKTTYDPTVRPGDTMSGSAKITGLYAGVLVTDIIPINPNHVFKLECWLKQANGSSVRHYIGLEAVDVDGNPISGYQAIRHKEGGNDSWTTLTAPLTPGDTTMSVLDASGFWNAAGSYKKRTLVIGDYQDSLGHTYKFYSRNVELGLWDENGINLTTNTFTFNKGLPSARGNPNDPNGTWPVGTPVWNGTTWNQYNYNLRRAIYASVGDWEKHVAFIGGVNYAGVEYYYEHFPPGTVGIRFIFILNYDNRNPGLNDLTMTTHVAGLSIREYPSGYVRQLGSPMDARPSLWIQKLQDQTVSPFGVESMIENNPARTLRIYDDLD